MATSEESSSQAALLIPNVGVSFASRVDYIKNIRRKVIQHLAVQFKNKSGRQELSRVPQLEQFLQYLDNCVEMTPQLRDATYIDKGLDLIIDAKYCFPARFVQTARDLKQKWTDQNWGEDLVVDEGSDSEGGADGSLNAVSNNVERQTTVVTAGGDMVTIHPPPRGHAIFGEHGIMHGVVITQGKNAGRVYRRNPNYRPHNAMVFGHNGLAVGAWWPMQMVALFHGAHGSSQGGIAGSARLGAYSIVISGLYDGLDDDRGDTVFYSGSQSHSNRNPNAASRPSNFTQALLRSLELANPIRVLRSAAGKSRWAPSVGIRYDGLYRIVRESQAHNEYGGLFWRFELQRLNGQPDLLDVVRTSPTAQQRYDFTKIIEGY
ncbi:hypothetical protein CMQ_880 [Grosmannia clavigera kw1407]|uniref:YDG domain-containing protein n=1 Tax=Grosmannia clavigera (strain kw1407 / UAMH 11150) TaxID=655863 RepID=F0XCJ5_GROCL|nr:uncharacterized protein CMQ_880 [Grosmannia clavigera kw1407]EFX03952.1 hypothetical protein CMQ_880 [Grosmannia clavigera kw1407]